MELEPRLEFISLCNIRICSVPAVRRRSEHRGGALAPERDEIRGWRRNRAAGGSHKRSGHRKLDPALLALRQPSSSTDSGDCGRTKGSVAYAFAWAPVPTESSCLALGRVEEENSARRQGCHVGPRVSYPEREIDEGVGRDLVPDQQNPRTVEQPHVNFGSNDRN